MLKVFRTQHTQVFYTVHKVTNVCIINLDTNCVFCGDIALGKPVKGTQDSLMRL